MRRIKVICLTEKKIKHVYVKDVAKSNYLFCIIAVVFLAISCVLLKINTNFTNYQKLSASWFNPISPLYSDLNGIVFAGVNFNNISKEHLGFITPIKCEKIDSVNGELHYTIDTSIMIIAPENGIIKNIGVLANGEKFIEVAHTKNIVTKIENIELTGVVINQIVSKGKEIATTKIGEIVKFSVYEDGVKQSGIKINKNEIVWQDYQ